MRPCSQRASSASPFYHHYALLSHQEKTHFGPELRMDTYFAGRRIKTKLTNHPIAPSLPSRRLLRNTRLHLRTPGCRLPPPSLGARPHPRRPPARRRSVGGQRPAARPRPSKPLHRPRSVVQGARPRLGRPGSRAPGLRVEKHRAVVPHRRRWPRSGGRRECRAHWSRSGRRGDGRLHEWLSEGRVMVSKQIILHHPDCGETGARDPTDRRSAKPRNRQA